MKTLTGVPGTSCLFSLLVGSFGYLIAGLLAAPVLPVLPVTVALYSTVTVLPTRSASVNVDSGLGAEVPKKPLAVMYLFRSMVKVFDVASKPVTV